MTLVEAAFFERLLDQALGVTVAEFTVEFLDQRLAGDMLAVPFVDEPVEGVAQLLDRVGLCDVVACPVDVAVFGVGILREV